LTIAEPPVDDFGGDNVSGSRNLAAAWFYRLAVPCASRGYPTKTVTVPSSGPNLASLLSSQWQCRHLGKMGAS